MLGVVLSHDRVVVAMSGGVDSSVTAFLLQRMGYEVVGVTFRLFSSAQLGVALAEQKGCEDAAFACHVLGISHHAVSCEDAFKKYVFDSFITSYRRGETPLPCALCNKHIKFPFLFEAMRRFDATLVATGHYIYTQHAQRRTQKNAESLQQAQQKSDIATPRDLVRDQSYFLFAVPRAMTRLLFCPLGVFTKGQVKRIAKAYGLAAIARKKSSQDLCFFGGSAYSDFLKRISPPCNEGPIRHVSGTELGWHHGIEQYTVGQRHGLGIAYNEPLYVVRLDMSENAVIVGPKEEMRINRIRVAHVNWLSPEPYAREVYVKTRSTQRPPVPATLSVDTEGRCEVALLSDGRRVSRGQACVFYENQGSFARLLGGGWIESCYRFL